MAAVGGEAGGGGGGGGGGAAKMVPMHRLFAFADRLDAALMAVGSVAALAEGLAMPFLAFLVGGLVDAFGDPDRANVVHSVSKVCAPLRRCRGFSAFSRSWLVDSMPHYLLPRLPISYSSRSLHWVIVFRLASHWFVVIL